MSEVDERFARAVDDPRTAEKHSERVSCIWSWNTKPQRKVRSFLHRRGYRLRLQVSEFLGMRDIVFDQSRRQSLSTDVFGAGIPILIAGWLGYRSLLAFPAAEAARDRQRDESSLEALQAKGWSDLLVSESKIAEKEQLRNRLQAFPEGEG